MAGRGINCSFTALPAEAVWEQWPLIVSVLTPALARLDGDYLDMEMIRSGVADGRMLIAAGTDGEELCALAVLSIGDVIIAGELRRMLDVNALVADLRGDRLEQMIEWAEGLAREENCAGIMLRGRRGWQRRLRAFRTANVVMVKEI